MRKNIKFILKFFIVITLSLVLLLSASALYKKGETYKGTYAGIDKFNSVPNNISFANFGPSYGMNCFNYETFEFEDKIGFNFALTMQDIYHDYAIYKTYEEKFCDGAVVAIPLSFFSFCSNVDEPTGTRYYLLLSKKYIKNYSDENYISSNYIPVYGKGSAIVRDITNDLLNSIMSNSVSDDIRNSANNTNKLEDTDKDDAENYLSKDSRTRIYTITNGNLIPYRTHIKKNMDILINWIEDMKANGLKPILLLTPYWHEYANGFDEELLKECYSDPVAMVIEKTGVDYINFCGEEYSHYIKTPEYFNNCDHVSKDGSKAFMNLYKEYLEKNGYVK